ncbi:hypothetical protein J2S45_002053 [Trueperella abortisuis]|uniref:Uncharacterized protein n=1 Tax=Trueperella abortisuis TaxID=445930 RepID=A0ABT9PKX7_9ACTO|nr:hypothetical protein [Trueperella abortisuis]
MSTSSCSCDAKKHAPITHSLVTPALLVLPTTTPQTRHNPGDATEARDRSGASSFSRNDMHPPAPRDAPTRLNHAPTWLGSAPTPAFVSIVTTFGLRFHVGRLGSPRHPRYTARSCASFAGTHSGYLYSPRTHVSRIHLPRTHLPHTHAHSRRSSDIRAHNLPSRASDQRPGCRTPPGESSPEALPRGRMELAETAAELNPAEPHTCPFTLVTIATPASSVTDSRRSSQLTREFQPQNRRFHDETLLNSPVDNTPPTITTVQLPGRCN